MCSCLHTMRSSSSVLTQERMLSSWTAGSSGAGGPAQAHLAHSYLLDSSLPSIPGTILVQWDSGSGMDLHSRILWAQGSLLATRLKHTLPWPGETLSLGTHRLYFGFQGKWQLTVITYPLASFVPLFPFSILRWLLAISSHSFSHAEWKNTSKSGATGSKFWARLCWNISLPGKVNNCHRMNTSLSLHFMVYFAVELPGTAEETQRIAELTLLFVFWETNKRATSASHRHKHSHSCFVNRYMALEIISHFPGHTHLT